MTVFIVEAVPPALRGRLALYLLEVRAGVYVGRLDRRVREKLWAQAKKLAQGASIVLLWKANTENGFEVLTSGHNRRVPVDWDGMRLIEFKPLPPKVNLEDLEEVEF